MLGPGRWLMLAGAVAVLVGVLIRRWASRYDLKDAAMDSAWTLLRGKRTADNPTAIEAKLKDIQSQPTWTGKATKTAGTAVGHVMAQVGHAVAMVLLVAGLALVAGGFIWR
jgi:hypothetical protein